MEVDFSNLNESNITKSFTDINSSLNINNNSNINNENESDAAPIVPLNNNEINSMNNTPSNINVSIKKEGNENKHYDNKNENYFISSNIFSDEINKKSSNNKEKEENLSSNNKKYNDIEEKIYTNNPDITKGEDNDYIKITENKNSINEYNDDSLKLKDKVMEMYNKGYLPLFLRMYSQSPTFYYAKFNNNLKTILNAYLKLNGYNPDDKYTLINDGEILDQNIPIDNLELKPLSIIDIIKD